MADVFIGTSGYSYAHWRKDAFYPRLTKQADELQFYSSRIPAGEINTTFHGLQTVQALQKWTLQVPNGFQFALKTPQAITHKARLHNVAEPWQEFVQRAQQGLASRLGPILVQLPPTFAKTTKTWADMVIFVDLIPASLKVAFEFRHRSWLCQVRSYQSCLWHLSRRW
jgi:uncharacterized protein YecE (DUF72 family)